MIDLFYPFRHPGYIVRLHVLNNYNRKASLPEFIQKYVLSLNCFYVLREVI